MGMELFSCGSLSGPRRQFYVLCIILDKPVVTQHSSPGLDLAWFHLKGIASSKVSKKRNRTFLNSLLDLGSAFAPTLTKLAFYVLPGVS